MSRQSRLHALRERRRVFGPPVELAAVEPEPEPEHDPRNGPRPPPPLLEPLEPLPPPEGLEGGYLTCGACESYVPWGALACARCSPSVRPIPVAGTNAVEPATRHLGDPYYPTARKT